MCSALIGWRKHVHQLILVEELQRLGVHVEFVNRALSDTPEDQLLFQIQSVIAEFEREKIMERSRRGKLYGARAGRVSVLSGAPYGYTYIRKKDGAEARYEISEREAAVVRRIFKLCGLERKSIGEIARLLQEEGVPAPHGKHWLRSTVGKLLRNPAYGGKAAYRKHRVAPRSKKTKLTIDKGGYPKTPTVQRERAKEDWIFIEVPALVTPSLVARVDAQLEMNKKFSSRNNTRHQYLLSGLLRCAECRYALHGITAGCGHGTSVRSYYCCTGSQGFHFPDGKAVCSAHYIRVEILDELVWQQTMKLIETPEAMLREYATRCEKKQRQKSDIDALRAKKQKDLTRLAAEKDRLLDLYQTGALSLAEIQTAPYSGAVQENAD